MTIRYANRNVTIVTDPAGSHQAHVAPLSEPARIPCAVAPAKARKVSMWRARHAAPCVDHIDQSCTQVCPVDCISADLTIDRKLYINPDTCIDCGACEAACPNSAILRTEDLPSAWADFAWIDATWYSDPDAARAVVNELVPAA